MNVSFALKMPLVSHKTPLTLLICPEFLGVYDISV